jgi:hypothetical protein
VINGSRVVRITKIKFSVAPVAAAKSRGQSGFWHRAKIDTGRQGLHRICDVSALWHPRLVVLLLHLPEKWALERRIDRRERCRCP